ncbi:MAG TPA: hypothetical protein V6D18_20850 [Thermosynechococcaceae cyanobacterium]
MEASQPRVKSIRTAEPTPVRQSPPAAEANVLKLPPRSPLAAGEAIAPAAVAQRKPQTKRQATKRKPMMTIRQHWIAHQQLLANDVQHLEAQAERINQRLAERSLLPSNVHTSNAHTPDLPAQTFSLEDEEADRLQAQLTRIRQLVADLGTAIAEGRTLEETAPIEIAASRLTATPVETAIAPSSVAQPETPPVPLSHQAEREAAETAAALRHLAKKARSLPQSPELESNQAHLGQAQLGRDFPRPEPKPQHSRKPQKLRLKDWLRLPQHPVDRAIDALTWIVAAAVIRVGTRILLTVFPALSPVVIVLMLAPAAIALLLTAFVPKSGCLPLYRLGLIPLGLLLGGRF